MTLKICAKKVNEQCKQMVPNIRPVFTVKMFENKSIVSAEIPSIDISERHCYFGGIGRIKGSYILKPYTFYIETVELMSRKGK